MAKDGTARGGARPGSGPKRKALTEKISAGKSASVIELPEPAELSGEDMPPIKEYMKAHQKNGEERTLRQSSRRSAPSKEKGLLFLCLKTESGRMPDVSCHDGRA